MRIHIVKLKTRSTPGLLTPTLVTLPSMLSTPYSRRRRVAHPIRSVRFFLDLDCWLGDAASSESSLNRIGPSADQRRRVHDFAVDCCPFCERLVRLSAPSYQVEGFRINVHSQTPSARRSEILQDRF